MVCNGSPWCEDKSDEDPTMCRQWKCAAEYWKCQNNICINDKFVCNGKNDFGCKGEDEDPVMCKEWNCSSGYVKCADCLPKH